MMRRIFLTICLSGVGILCSAVPVSASLHASPTMLDLEAFPHDEVRFNVSVVNETGSTRHVSPTIGELDIASGLVTTAGSPNDSVRLISANIELPREDFLLAPGASRVLSGKVNVSPYLPPGVYHAVVLFPDNAIQGGTANMRIEQTVPQALLNITVRKDIRERLNLLGFKPAHRFYLHFPTQLVVTLQNGGNVTQAPSVTIRFFGREDDERGQADVKIPDGGIKKGETANVDASWGGDRGFGRYRAQAEVLYGATNGGQLLMATTTFWVIPLWLILSIMAGVVIVSYVAARAITRTRSSQTQ